MSHFEKLSGPRVQAVLNLLVEAPFFYRHDDPEAFAYLRRHRAEFERFFAELFGWELLVDAATARVYKERWHNRALRPSQRDAFDPSRRLDCLGFLLTLEYYERLLEADNRGPADEPPPRFAFGELFDHARARLAALAPGRLDDEAVRRMLRQLMPMLERYRFVREVPRDAGEAVDDDRVLYEALPGLYHYDARRLAPGAVARALGGDDASDARDAGDAGDASDAGDAAEGRP